MNLSTIVTRAIDICGSLAGIILLSPLLVLCYIAVRFGSPGPAIFCQPRLGLNGEPFVLYKFRSMCVGAPAIRNPDGSSYSGACDARVTNVGKLLRAASLDELPQLFNVLRGHMSLVGPRPDEVAHRQFYTEAEERKLAVKPGITGLAQISGRNNITWERRKALDVEYVDRKSVWLDISILGKTISYVIQRKDIYSNGCSNSRTTTTSH